MKYKNIASKLLTNKIVLYIIFIIAFLNVSCYIMNENTDAVLYFIVLSIIISNFSKNMIIILGVPIILVNLFVIGKRSTIEGMESINQSPMESVSEATGSTSGIGSVTGTSGTGTGSGTSGTGSGLGSGSSGSGSSGPSTSGPTTSVPSTSGASTSGPSTSGLSTSGPKSGPSTSGPSTSGPSTSGPKSGISANNPSKSSTGNDSNRDKLKEKIQDKKNNKDVDSDNTDLGGANDIKYKSKTEKSKNDIGGESFEVGRKSKSGYDIDYASTIEDAYDELNKVLGGDGIKQLTNDTKNLMQQQLHLAEAMKGMGPLIEGIAPIMEQAKGILGGVGVGGNSLDSLFGKKKDK